MAVYRKFKINEQNLDWAAYQLRQTTGRNPTGREAARWFRAWASKQSRSYSIHPLLTFAAFFAPIALAASIGDRLSIESTGILGTFLSIVILAAGVGSVMLLIKAHKAYEDYRWGLLAKRFDERQGTAKQYLWMDEFQRTVQTSDSDMGNTHVRENVFEYKR